MCAVHIAHSFRNEGSAFASCSAYRSVTADNDLLVRHCTAQGYQISQYDEPICSGGKLEVEVDGQMKRWAVGGGAACGYGCQPATYALTGGHKKQGSGRKGDASNTSRDAKVLAARAGSAQLLLHSTIGGAQAPFCVPHRNAL